MRGLFLNLIGEVDDPFEEWEQWDTNGAIKHINVNREPDWEQKHIDSLVILFGAATTLEEEAILADISLQLQSAGVETVAVNCAHHDEVCVQTFKPYNFPAIYFKHPGGKTVSGDFWQGYRGTIEAEKVVAWTGVDVQAQASESGDGADSGADSKPQREL